MHRILGIHVLFHIFQCGCECIRDKDKTYHHLEEVSGKLISVHDLLAYALIDDNSVELSRISQLFLDQKGLDCHEYVNYLHDEDEDEYCDELGLTLFTYITKIKICVFLKDGEKWSTDYLANETNCSLWLMKLKGSMYVRIAPVEKNTDITEILPDEPIEYDEDCMVVQLVSPKWKRRHTVTFEETKVKRTKKSSGGNKKTKTKSKNKCKKGQKMEPTRKMQKKDAKQACKAKIKEITKKRKRRNSGSHCSPKKQKKEQEEVPENRSGPVDPTDSLIPNQDKPLFIPEKETDPITRGNVKPTDAGIGSEKNTNPKNANKEEVKLSDSEIEYVSDANTSGNIESKDIGAKEIVEPPGIRVEQSDPEKGNPEKTDNPVTDEVEPPAIPVEELDPETENPEKTDNPMTDKVEPPAIPVEQLDPEKENPEKTDNPVTDKVEPPVIPVEQLNPETEIPDKMDNPMTDKIELPTIPVEKSDPEKEDPERVHTPVTDEVQPPAIPVEQTDPEKENPERVDTSSDRSRKKR